MYVLPASLSLSLPPPRPLSEKSSLPRVNWTTYVFRSAGIFPRSHAHAKGHANADVKASERRTVLAHACCCARDAIFLTSIQKNWIRKACANREVISFAGAILSNYEISGGERKKGRKRETLSYAWTISSSTAKTLIQSPSDLFRKVSRHKSEERFLKFLNGLCLKLISFFRGITSDFEISSIRKCLLI